MGYPLFIEPVKSDLPSARKDPALSPAPADVRTARRSGPRPSGSNRLTPAQWIAIYGPDHTTAARLRRTRDSLRPLSPEIPVLNVMEAFCRMHVTLQSPFERRLRRVLRPLFNELKLRTEDMLRQLSETQARLDRREESHLFPAERERMRSHTLGLFSTMDEVTRLTNAELDALRTIKREIESVAAVSRPAALARVRLRAVRNRRWNSSPTDTPGETARSGETDSHLLTRQLNGLRERWATRDTGERRLPQGVDGLGDRERSPEELWNTLRFTMTPDPELPSNSSSFTSMPNTTQRSFEQTEESRGVHWLGLTDDMNADEADALLPPTANGDQDCDPLDSFFDGLRSSARRDEQTTRPRRVQPPGRISRDVLSALNTRLESRDGEDQQRQSMARAADDSVSRAIRGVPPSGVSFGGLEEEAAAIDAEDRGVEGGSVEGQQLSMEGFMARIEGRLGHTPTQGEWEGQLSVGADDDEAAEQPTQEAESQRPQDSQAPSDTDRFDYEQALNILSEVVGRGDLEEERRDDIQAMFRRIARSSGVSDEGLDEIDARRQNRRHESEQAFRREAGGNGPGQEHRESLLSLLNWSGSHPPRRQ